MWTRTGTWTPGARMIRAGASEARRQEMAAAAIILSDQRHGPDRNEKPRPTGAGASLASISDWLIPITGRRGFHPAAAGAGSVGGVPAAWAWPPEARPRAGRPAGSRALTGGLGGRAGARRRDHIGGRGAGAPVSAVSVPGPLAKMNTRSSASTTPPAIHPHIALLDPGELTLRSGGRRGSDGGGSV